MNANPNQPVLAACWLTEQLTEGHLRHWSDHARGLTTMTVPERHEQLLADGVRFGDAAADPAGRLDQAELSEMPSGLPAIKKGSGQ